MLASSAFAKPPIEGMTVGERPGLSGHERETRIVGGNFTTNSKYPWQALLLIDGNGHPGPGVGLCGGVLIHPLIVMTAAHCLVEDDGKFEQNLEVLALLGDTGFFEMNEVHEGIGFWAHDEYFPDRHPFTPAVNDLAFVTLDTPSPLPRILVAGADERALWTPGREAFVTGWGTTSEGGEISEILKEALVPIIDDGTCADPAVNGSFGFVASVMVCAGYLAGGQDACQGDSGGPLQSPIDGGGFRLTGIVSWGIGCARPNKPGVYTRIGGDPLLGFIREAVPFIEAAEGFPPQYTGINVIGSGARPPGCAAAEQALAQASLGVAPASAAVRKATKAAKRASRSLRKARKRGQAVRRAAKRRVRRARKRARIAWAKLIQANAALNAAAEQRVAICG